MKAVDRRKPTVMKVADTKLTTGAYCKLFVAAYGASGIAANASKAMHVATIAATSA